MSTFLNLTRQRIVDAALELFGRQGLAETTTKQIAELAEVNEVTLFRQFGNKQGVLLAILSESDVFARLAASLGQQIVAAAEGDRSPASTIRHYAEAYLDRLTSAPELLRSLIGEAGKYPTETRKALGQGIQQMYGILADYLGQESGDRSWLSLVNATLLGYAVLEATTDRGLGNSRETFLEDLVQFALKQPIALAASVSPQSVIDLSAPLVNTLFQRAQKQGAREWALMYVLFGAGVSPAEIARLERVHHLSDRNSQVLQITQGAIRQVPVNQWIIGKRYGTYLKNPLTSWLKGRKDEHSALFINADEEPITEGEIQAIWNELTKDLLTLEGQPPAIEQAQQTWCVEMLWRGMSLEDMQVLTGMSMHQLAPYGKRAKQKAVVEQGLSLDRRK